MGLGAHKCAEHTQTRNSAPRKSFTRTKEVTPYIKALTTFLPLRSDISKVATTLLQSRSDARARKR